MVCVLIPGLESPTRDSVRLSPHKQTGEEIREQE